MNSKMFFEDTFGDAEPGSLSYHEVERMMLNSKILEPLYDAIPMSASDRTQYYYDQDWARRNIELKSEILKTFESNKDRIYEAASRYRLNIRRVRNVLSELAGNFNDSLIFLFSLRIYSSYISRVKILNQP